MIISCRISKFVGLYTSKPKELNVQNANEYSILNNLCRVLNIWCQLYVICKVDHVLNSFYYNHVIVTFGLHAKDAT
jgi:hypothetical protein